MRQLSPTIWQSNEPEARSISEGGTEAWKSLGLRAVICPAFNVRIPYNGALAILMLPVWDDTQVPAPWFDLAVQFHKCCGPTLVHCAGGLNRSVAFSAALLIDEGKSMDEVLVLMRPGCTPQMIESVTRWALSRK